MTRYSASMSEALKKIRNTVSERDLTDTEEKRREEIAKDLPDQEFKDRYGARWKSVKMATATKMAKKESLDEGVRWKVKIEGLPPVYMDASSASEVRTKLRKLVKQPDMIQDIDRVTDTQMKKDLRDFPAQVDSATTLDEIKAVWDTDMAYGTDASAFSKMAYQYFDDPKVVDRSGNRLVTKDEEDRNDCQLNYVIVIGDVKDCRCILIDDIVDSAGTLCNAAEALIESGAKSVSAYVTHGVLSGGAVARVTASPLENLVTTDSIMATEAVRVARNINQLTIAPLIGEAMLRISLENSVSSLFD